MKNYIAHSQNAEGEKQDLKDHNRKVADLMKTHALSKEYEELYAYCGQIHDIGKYTDDFQKRVAGENIRTPHAIYGAYLAWNNGFLQISLSVYGHHAGLPNRSDLSLAMSKIIKCGLEDYDLVCERWREDTKDEIVLQENNVFNKIPDLLQKELFVRILFSSLVDADSLDTERHFDYQKNELREYLPLDVDFLLNKIDNKFCTFKQDSEVNQLRHDVLLYAESKANLPQGSFSLTLPTGMGKTLCSINWALHHAKYHSNIKRIIIVLPFISIIDQTSETLKQILNDETHDWILEHHSNVIYDNGSEDETYSPKQLATENWDYPIIVTTTVQFFESLFNNKRTQCRKLHNIQDSIIIFDEIQKLPFVYTEPSLTMLNNLQQLCRCSLLFCTATQPDFETREGFSGINHIEPLVEDPQTIFSKTQRVIYHPINDYQEIDIDDLASLVTTANQSALVVFNTKKKAKMFYEATKGSGTYKLYHLSATMCPIHRKATIEAIRQSLDKKERIIVSSTQLIEAGVDMDFPTVYREIAPLESIIQSAGRCNREGRLTDENGNKKKGDVYIFRLTQEGQPDKEYKVFSDFALSLYKENENRLYSHDFYCEYFRGLIDLYSSSEKYEKTKAINRIRGKLQFQTVSELYNLIDSDTISLFIYRYDEESYKLYMDIKDKEFLNRRDRQLVSQYCVQVTNGFLKKNESFIGEEKCGLKVWYGKYSNEETGLPFIDELTTLAV